jgi:hypothetical protein
MPAWANSLRDPISKIITAKQTGGMAQVVEWLLYKWETLQTLVLEINKQTNKQIPF